jgi:hypothetical protein
LTIPICPWRKPGKREKEGLDQHMTEEWNGTNVREVSLMAPIFPEWFQAF